MKFVVDELPYYGEFCPFWEMCYDNEVMISVLNIGASIKSALTIIRMSAVFLSRRARLSLRSQSRKITILMVVAVKLVGIVESRVQYTYVPLATNFLTGR